MIQSYNAGTRTITFRAFTKDKIQEVPSVTITLPPNFFKWAARDLRLCVQMFIAGFGESMAQENVASKWLLDVYDKHPYAIYQLEMLVYALAVDKCMYSDEIEAYLTSLGHWQAPKPAQKRSWWRRMIGRDRRTGTLAVRPPPGHNSLRAGHRTWDFA